jgi:hypothetical protein
MLKTKCHSEPRFSRDEESPFKFSFLISNIPYIKIKKQLLFNKLKFIIGYEVKQNNESPFIEFDNNFIINKFLKNNFNLLNLVFLKKPLNIKEPC